MMHSGVSALVGVVAGLGVWLAAPARAQTPAAASPPVNPVVVELYTSQGCVSCPPADEWLATIATREDVIALALHVDYWDYLGWADSFANPSFTARQKRYAKAAGARMIYTPQIIIDGVERVEGLRPEQIDTLIAKHAAQPAGVTLEVERSGDMLRVRARAEPPLTRGALIQIVRYLPQATVTIERGENAGRTATHHNIVTDWRPVGEWSGQEPLTLHTAAGGADPLVVIVQEQGPGHILAAARLR